MSKKSFLPGCLVVLVLTAVTAGGVYLYLLATAIVKSALIRTESRGSHWRSDYPQSSNKWLSRVIEYLDKDGNWYSEVEEI